ncbi:MAG: gamma carbonic anhydrase family protein [Methanomassiliicoccales archaeon]|jgi:carbonic anhydrase/acetyltransferase-like protein (isoleucine patch superfamily)
MPYVSEDKVYIDPTAVIIGDVTIEAGVSVWPFAVLRGDLNRIVIGEGSNIQDHVAVHSNTDFPNIIGKNVSIGHGAVVHGVMIGDNCIIGMHSTLMTGAVIGEECIVGGGALITGGTKIPPRSIVVGLPGKIIRQDDSTIKEKAIENACEYHKLRDAYLSGKHKHRKVP